MKTEVTKGGSLEEMKKEVMFKIAEEKLADREQLIKGKSSIATV